MAIQLHADAADLDVVCTSINNILTRTSLCSMATVNIDNSSHINTAYFANDEELRISFLSNPATKHCQNIFTRPSTAITVFDTDQPWGEVDLTGLQLFGVSRIASEDEIELAEGLYNRRFPGYRKWIDSLSKTKRAELESRFFLFEAKSLKILDEEQFGEEIFIDVTVSRP